MEALLKVKCLCNSSPGIRLWELSLKNEIKTKLVEKTRGTSVSLTFLGLLYHSSSLSANKDNVFFSQNSQGNNYVTQRMHPLTPT